MEPVEAIILKTTIALALLLFAASASETRLVEKVKSASHHGLVYFRTKNTT